MTFFKYLSKLFSSNTEKDFNNRDKMRYTNPQEKETNKLTNQILILLQQDEYDKIIDLYYSIPERERTGEQTEMTVCAFIFTQETQKARELLDKWEVQGKEDKQWYVQYAWSYYVEKNYEKAIPYFEKAELLGSYDILQYHLECNEKVNNEQEVDRLSKRIKYGGSDYTKENYYSKSKNQKEFNDTSSKGNIRFTDLNFKFAIIDELMYKQEVLKPKFDVYEFSEKHNIDIEEEGYEIIPQVFDYFKNLEISEKYIENIKEINQDGGDEIYLNIIPFWDGEDNIFDIQSFADIEKFPNLKSITLFGEELDISSLK